LQLRAFGRFSSARSSLGFELPLFSPIFPPIFRSPSGSTRFCSASSIVLQLTDVGELGMGMGARVPPFLLTASWFAG